MEEKSTETSSAHPVSHAGLHRQGSTTVACATKEKSAGGHHRPLIAFTPYDKRVGEMSTETLQAALRMLFLLDKAGLHPSSSGGAPPAGAVAVISSEKKLQALHFWMRNPDYLAYEILDGVERGVLDPQWIDRVVHLLEREEPALRRYPMLRYFFGAYEPIDDSFSILVAAGLAECRRFGTPGKVRQTKFILLELGREHARRIATDHPELRWYPERAGVVAEISGTRTGDMLKKSQYRLSEYAETALGDVIQPIDDVVYEKLEQLRNQT